MRLIAEWIRKIRRQGRRTKERHIKQFYPINSLHSLWINLPKGQLLDELLIFIKGLAEYAFGIHIGYFIGWATGLYVGRFYVGQFEPVYMDDLSQLSYWRAAPYIFARNGAWIGVAAGMIAIAVINHRPLIQEVDSLYEVETENPNGIMRLLGKSVGQIENKILK